MTRNVLIVDDDQGMCEMLEVDLKIRGFNISWCTTAAEAILLVKEESFDAILTDLKMPRMGGIDFCHHIVSNNPHIPVVIMTAFGSMETAIDAIRAGAFDFVTKPMETDILEIILNRAIKHKSLQEQIKQLKEVVAQTQEPGEIIGNSLPMRELYARLKRISDSDITVLISGESGTGKELVARALHKQSTRELGPFISINCAAIPENLLESELFGHTKGAFTDAKATHKGLFALAEGGTLFLDEIGDFPLSLQPKLLRALEEHKVRPLGSEKEINFDARIITATNHNLESAVKEGTFRADLFFRINVMNVSLPPLRTRGNDILLLAQGFVEKYAEQYKKEITGLSNVTVEKLLGYSWHGNVRELKNVMERAVALTNHERLIPEDLPEQIRSTRNDHVYTNEFMHTDLVSLEKMNNRYIQHVLKAVNGNKTRAARILNVDRKTLYRKIEKQETYKDT